MRRFYYITKHSREMTLNNFAKNSRLFLTKLFANHCCFNNLPMLVTYDVALDIKNSHRLR